MKVCINEECHYHHWDETSQNCSRDGLEGDMHHSYFPHCKWRIISEDENEQVTEPDLEKLGFCLKCGTRPCTCEQKYGEEKAG